jgi:CheY-like chemotaxis protein
MSPKKILIVDDNQVELLALSVKLKARGYDTLLAEDGAAAVSQARREKPDLILLDISFPPDVAHGGGVPWDGFLVLNWLRRLEEARDIPVIFVTGGDPAKYKARALAAGAVGFMHKPFQTEDLLSTIGKVLASQKTTAPLNQPKNKRILLVDDEGDWRFVASTCLQDAGYEVLTAQGIAEARVRLEGAKLDAIVLDLNLGGESGLSLMELVKQQRPGVPVIIYTGLDHDAQAIQTILKQGARQYLRKGTMGELCKAIETILN